MADHRLLSKDPNYERIQAQRAARASAVFGNMAFWLGIGSCTGAMALQTPTLLYIAGVFAFVWIVFKARATYYRKTYVE